jgi:hypothetical protein
MTCTNEAGSSQSITELTYPGVTRHLETLRASTDRTDHDLRPFKQEGLVLMLTR